MRTLTRLAAAVVAGTAAATAVAQQAAPAPIVSSPPPAAPGGSVARPEGTAATVNGAAIPEVAVWRALRQFPAAEHAAARKEIVNYLIDNALIDQYLAALQIKVEPAETDKLLAELQAELKKANKDYAKELEAMMLTEAEFKAEAVAQMRWDKFLKQQGTDQVLEGYFAKTPSTFDGTLVRARHVLITTGGDPAKVAAAKQKLEAIKAEITAEADKAAAATAGDALAKQAARGKTIDELFAEKAKANSDCPSKANGGDLQFFPRVGAMVEPFADAAFKLELFGMSDVVMTDFGSHLILCTARNPGKTRTFAEVKEDVRAVFAMQLRQAVIAMMKPKAQIAVTAPAPK
jgi:parvulin-like peptidyl-prolyl isomerase